MKRAGETIINSMDKNPVRFGGLVGGATCLAEDTINLYRVEYKRSFMENTMDMFSFALVGAATGAIIMRFRTVTIPLFVGTCAMAGVYEGYKKMF